MRKAHLLQRIEAEGDAAPTTASADFRPPDFAAEHRRRTIHDRGLEHHILNGQLVLAALLLEGAPRVTQCRQADSAEQRVAAVVLRVATQLHDAVPDQGQLTDKIRGEERFTHAALPVDGEHTGLGGRSGLR